MSQEKSFFNREEQKELCSNFLKQSGFLPAVIAPVNADWGVRKFSRITRDDGKTAILMESLPQSHEESIPGHGLADFLRIGRWLGNIGIHVPEIYAEDETCGLVLMEDLGDTKFPDAAGNGVGRIELYTFAADVIAHMQKSCRSNNPGLQNYRDCHVHKGKRRIVDWYMPIVRGAKNSDTEAEEFEEIWKSIEQDTKDLPNSFVHIDFHAENLLWLPDEAELARCGVIDFQGAVLGSPAYDLTNLLEDIRTDVPAEVKDAALKHFCAVMEMDGEDRKVFYDRFRILAAQYHCRIAGQLVKMAVAGGNRSYLDKYMARTLAYLRADIEAPILLPLKKWFEERNIALDKIPEIDLDNAKNLIRMDAF